MNKQLNKLRAANARDRAKVEMLLARMKVRDEKITELENVDILGIVRAYSLTPEMLAEVLANMPKIKPMKKEEKSDESDPA